MSLYIEIMSNNVFQPYQNAKVKLDKELLQMITDIPS